MKRYFIVTIDTEGDNQWEQHFVRNVSLKNIEEIPKLQALFNRLKVTPCYLITYPVATHRYSISMFKEFLSASICEIGSHLHTWSTPPISNSEIENKSFLHSLPKGLQSEKFDNLHTRIAENLKVEPKSYRGGKYSFDVNLLEILEERGYLLDTSVTPFNDWSHIGGPDFIDCITTPYFPSKKDALKRGNFSVLEVPVSIDFDRNIPGKLKELILRIPLRFHMQGILKRLRLCKLVWLDPSFQTFLEMKTLIDLILKKQKNPCINLMFHSSVLLAGGSPYNKTEKDVSNFYQKLEAVLSYLIEGRGVVNLMPKDFAETYKNEAVSMEGRTHGTQKERIKKFFSTTAGEYKKKYFEQNLDFQVFAFLARKKSLTSLLDREYRKNGSKFQRCLDIGCGTGDYLMGLLDFSEEVIGADYAEGMLREARDKIKGHGHNIRLSQEDIEGLSFADNYFDFIVCAGVLEYLYDDTKAFQEIHRVLKPGGHAYITFPNKFSLFMQLDRLYSALTHLGGDILDRLHVFEFILGRCRLNAAPTIHRIYGPPKVKEKVKRLGFKYRKDIFSGYGSFYLSKKIPYYHLLAGKLEHINRIPFMRHGALNYIIQIQK